MRSVARVSRPRSELADKLSVMIVFDASAAFPTLPAVERAFSEPAVAAEVLVAGGLPLATGVTLVAKPAQVQRDSVEDVRILVGGAIGGVAVVLAVACAVGCAVVRCRRSKRRSRLKRGETTAQAEAVASEPVGRRGRSSIKVTL